MAPPLRPGLPPGLPAGMSPTGPPGGYGPQNGPPIYNNSTQAQQQFNNMQMNRNFAAEGAGKGTPACRSQFFYHIHYIYSIIMLIYMCYIQLTGDLMYIFCFFIIVRFGAMPPVGMQRQGQPHVSSSTHPQNMGKRKIG